MAKAFIGTSGFSYHHWRGVFYPHNLPTSSWLKFYSNYFSSVEINATFYHLPKKEDLTNWSSQTPADFVFAVKGSRFITHLKKLSNCQESLELFFENVSGLADKLAVVLWQLPANLPLNLSNLEQFCNWLAKNRLSKEVRQAFEFRHPSWFAPSAQAILKKYNFALCLAHSGVWPFEEMITASYTYLRFHGEHLYSSNYDDDQLAVWASKIKRWLADGLDVYAYFNNDALGYAVKNARTLATMVSH